LESRYPAGILVTFEFAFCYSGVTHWVQGVAVEEIYSMDSVNYEEDGGC
jgi:hypothetical protein